MKRIVRGLAALLAVTFLSAVSAEGSEYSKLLLKVDYGEDVTYVIGQKIDLRGEMAQQGDKGVICRLRSNGLEADSYEYRPTEEN